MEMWVVERGNKKLTVDEVSKEQTPGTFEAPRCHRDLRGSELSQITFSTRVAARASPNVFTGKAFSG